MDSSSQLTGEIMIPAGIMIPGTNKIFELIKYTAMKTRANNQLELIIKVKQEFNETFDFLNIESPLHNFYQVIYD